MADDASKGVSLRAATKVVRRVLDRRAYVSPEKAAYERLAARGYRPAAIVDVGAYEGNWTRLARSVFPDAPAIMIEAQEGKVSHLQKVCSDLPGTHYVSALLGGSSSDGVLFYEMETGSSFFPEQSNVARVEKVLPMRTLDEVVAGLDGPLFLKVDVQGAELQVLRGGTETLGRADLVQLEVAMLPYNAGAPSMLEVMNFMDEAGFVPFDVSGFSRPNDLDLVQIDLLFVPRGSPLRPTYFNF